MYFLSELRRPPIFYKHLKVIFTINICFRCRSWVATCCSGVLDCPALSNTCPPQVEWPKKWNFPCFHFYGYYHFSFYRNMAREHESLVNCLRYKSVEELTEFSFETPSFLTSMGPSRDGVLIPSDFGIDTSYSSNNIRKRAHASTYQASLP